MQCPLCTIELNLVIRKGVEIDYCPKCGGVWLDHWELDKLTDSTMTERKNPKNPSGRDEILEDRTKRDAFHGSSHEERRYKYGKRNSTLREIKE